MKENVKKHPFNKAMSIAIAVVLTTLIGAVTITLVPDEMGVDWAHQVGNILLERTQVHDVAFHNEAGTGCTIRIVAWTKHTPAGNWQWAGLTILKQLAEAGVKFDSFTRYMTPEGVFVFDGKNFVSSGVRETSASKLLVKKEPGVFAEFTERQVLADLPVPKS